MPKLFLFLLAVFTMATLPSASWADDVVTSALDDGSGGTLRKVIADATDGATITFASNLAGETITLESGIGIGKSLTIKGNGQKLVPADGASIGAFSIEKASHTVIIEGLLFDGFTGFKKVNDVSNNPFPSNDFHDSGWGGAIHANCNGDLTVKSCIFTNNKAGNNGDGRGGAILKAGGSNDNAALTVLGCTFIGNKGNLGAAIWVHDRIDGNKVRLEGNVFYDNLRSNGTIDHYDGNNKNGAIVSYNAYNGSNQFTYNDASQQVTLGTGNLQIAANPLDENFVPLSTSGEIQILPASIPNYYPATDFNGRQINGSGFAGAVQTDPIPGLFGLSLSRTGIKANTGDPAVTLTAVPVAVGGATPTYSWSSSNEAVATVSNGTITFGAAGSAVITVTATYNSTVLSAQTNVTVSNLVNEDYTYNRSSWTVAANQYGNHGLWGTFTEAAWTVDNKHYPMDLLDGSLKSGWESGTDNPKYIVIDMKQDLTVKSVDISGPLEGNNQDWPSGCLDGYINIYLTNNNPSANYSNYTVGWDDATRVADYVSWTNTLNLPNINGSVPSDWGNILAAATGTYNDKYAAKNKPDPFVLPANSHGRYLIIVFEKSSHSGPTEIALGEVKVSSPAYFVSVNNSQPGYGSVSSTQNKEVYALNDAATVDLSATTINPSILSVGWKIPGSEELQNATYTYTGNISSDLVFETVYSLNLPTPLNSTGWNIESNAGTQHRGSLSNLIDVGNNNTSNHSNSAYNSRVKKYFAIEMPSFGYISAVSLFNTDGVTYHDDADGHASDFAGKRLSVYLTDTKPDGDLNIDGGVPAEWGEEQGYMTAPIFNVADNIQDTATVVMPTTVTPHKYVVLVVDHKNDYIEVGGIRLYGILLHGISYASSNDYYGHIDTEGVKDYYTGGESYNIKLTAVPNRFSSFVKWELPDGTESTENPLTVSGNINANLHYNAVFSQSLPNPYNRKFWTAVGKNGNSGDKNGADDWRNFNGGGFIWPCSHAMLAIDDIANPSDDNHSAANSAWFSHAAPSYIVIDMKEPLDVGYVTIDGPKPSYSDWIYGTFKGRIDVYVTNDLTGYTPYDVNYCESDNDRKDKYWSWYESINSTIPAYNSISTAGWGSVVGYEEGFNNNKDAKIYPATGTNGRYLIIVFNDGTRADWGVAVGNINVYGSTTQTYSYNVWTGASDNDWDNSGNWCRGDEVLSGAKVLVPSRLTNYPVVTTDETTIAELTLEPGAELGRQDLLTVDRVNVAYDFGATRNRTWLLASPIQGVYAGDFTFGGYPSAYLYEYVTDGGEDGEDGTGAWTQVKDLDKELTPGTGFALYLQGDDESGKGLSKTEGIVRQPYFDIADSAAHPAHSYVAANNASSFYLYKNDKTVNTEVVAATGDRTNSGKLYNGSTVPCNFGIGTTESEGTGINYFALVGNPLIATLDFSSFRSASNNSSTIKDNFHIWTGTAYASYTNNGWYGANYDGGAYIAPLQAFFVEKADDATETSLTLAASMSATANHATLRSPAQNRSVDKLDITATAGNVSILTFIARRDSGSDLFSDADSRKLLDGVSAAPEVYTLKNDLRGRAVPTGANIVRGGDITVPVGIATEFEGEITLTFAGMDSYSATITLLDAITGERINLTGLSSYEHRFAYAPRQINGETVATNDRFSLQISHSPLAINRLADADVRFAVNGRNLNVATSDGSQLRTVEIWSVQGQLIAVRRNIDAATLSVNLPGIAPEAVIVRATTDRGVRSEKLTVKSGK